MKLFTTTTTFSQNPQITFSNLHYKPSILPKPISINPKFPNFSKPKKTSFKIINSSQKNPQISPINNSNKTQKNPFFTLLKTPLTIAIASTTIFFCGLKLYRPLPAIAEQPKIETLSQEDDESYDIESTKVKEKSLEEYLIENDKDVEALKSLMEVKIKLKKLGEAIDVINKLVELEPNEMEWPLLRSHMYSYMGEPEMAKAGFEAIIEKDPVRVEAFHGLVMAVSQGEVEGKELDEVTMRVEAAMEKAKKGKEVEQVRDFKLLIAQIRVIQGNYNEALKVYQELVKEEPRDFRPYLCQGIIYTLLRKKDEAEKQFDKYKRLVPKGHPYAKFFDENMIATKVFSQMAENERMKVGSKN